MSKAPIAILGAGNMASALALVLARHKRPIHLYCIEADVEEDIRKNACNTKYLAGHHFPKHVTASGDLERVLTDAEDLIIAVPSFAVADVIAKTKPFLTDKIKSISSVTKGIDPLLVAEQLPAKYRTLFCVLGGPAIAVELAKGSPTGFVIAGRNARAMLCVKHLLETDAVKCATSRDLLGVSLASTLKNPYAIALGMCDGLGYPANAKALVLTLAITEMERLIIAAGGQSETATGLAGLGDLVATGMSPHSRNRTYGERLVGSTSKAPLDLGLGTVEGIAASSLAMELAHRRKVRAPLLEAIDQCLRSRKNFERPFIHYLKHLTLS